MHWLTLFIIPIALLAWWFVAHKTPDSNYRKKNALFSPAEISFFSVLNIALAPDYLVFSKVRIADILAPSKGLKRKAWQLSFRQIASHHFDFVLCDKQTFSAVAAVELDERRFLSRRRAARERLIDTACESAGVPIVRFPASPVYQIDQVINKVNTALKPVALAKNKAAMNEALS